MPAILRTTVPFAKAAVVVLTCMSFLVPTRAQTKRRIGILSFAVTPDAKQNAASKFGIHDDLGRDMSDLLLQKLVQSGKFSVIEQTRIDEVLKQQLTSNSDRNDPATAAKLGKILGVQAIAIGSVMKFDGEVSKSSTQIPFMKKLPGTGISRNSSNVAVEVTVRLVDVNTAEVLAAATGSGDASNSKTTVQGSAVNTDTHSPDFGDTMVGQAVLKALNSVADQLEASPAAEAVAAPVVPRLSYSGLVADVSGKTLILTVGTSAGVHVGDIVEVSHPGRTVKNPQTGAVLKVITTPLGQATITEADASSSTATFNGTGNVAVNDKVSSTAP